MPQLCVYRFDPGATFEGGVIGAIERAELVGDKRMLDGLFVARDAETGAVDAITLRAASGDNRFVVFTDFRLNPERRRALTEAALAEHPHAEEVGTTLEPGAAVLVVLVGGEPPESLADAVERAGGRIVAGDQTDAQTLAELGGRLRDALA